MNLECYIFITSPIPSRQGGPKRCSEGFPSSGKDKNSRIKQVVEIVSIPQVNTLFSLYFFNIRELTDYLQIPTISDFGLWIAKFFNSRL